MAQIWWLWWLKILMLIWTVNGQMPNLEISSPKTTKVPEFPSKTIVDNSNPNQANSVKSGESREDDQKQQQQRRSLEFFLWFAGLFAITLVLVVVSVELQKKKANGISKSSHTTSGRANSKKRKKSRQKSSTKQKTRSTNSKFQFSKVPSAGTERFPKSTLLSSTSSDPSVFDRTSCNKSKTLAKFKPLGHSHRKLAKSKSKQKSYVKKRQSQQSNRHSNPVSSFNLNPSTMAAICSVPNLYNSKQPKKSLEKSKENKEEKNQNNSKFENKAKSQTKSSPPIVMDIPQADVQEPNPQSTLLSYFTSNPSTSIGIVPESSLAQFRPKM